MDPRERIQDPEQMMRAALDGRQAQIWTALPGIITGFDASLNTVNVQPTIQVTFRDKAGVLSLVTMPVLKMCPVQFPGAGGLSLTFPVTSGDECLVLIASRCIDSWWQNGGIQPPAEFRMHDLSDGMVLRGFKSKPNAVPQISTNGLQLRTNDPELAYLEITKDGRINMYAKEGFNFVTPSANGYIFSGNMAAIGDFRASGEVTTGLGNKKLSTHVHSGITVGGANTAAPVPGS